MSRHMRTTIRLNDALLDQAKREARRRGMTLTVLIEESLRRELARASKPEGKREWIKLPTGDCGGPLPGVDLNNSAALWDLLDEDLPLYKRR